MKIIRSDLNRVMGSLIGVHVGDSLGSTLEFQPATSSCEHTQMIGGGFFELRPGQPTDDTELTLVLLESLVQEKFFNSSDFAKRLVRWAESDPIDIGGTIKEAILKLILGLPPALSGSKNQFSQGNGSMMRCTPMAIFFSGDQLKTQSKLHTQITHAHPICILFDQIYLECIERCYQGESREEILNFAIAQIDKLDPKIKNPLMKNLMSDWQNLRTTGWVVDSLSAALWALKNSDNFRDGVIQVINRGFDADTTGAITGGLLGAYYGLNSIPEQWLQPLELFPKMRDLISQAK